jgi:FkbM family methyltransferase
LKQLLKQLLKKIPIAFTQNQRYDAQTKKVIARVCKANSNCIDIGCHRGEVLDIMRKHAPQGKHFAFEPLPHLFQDLQSKYADTKCQIFDYALSDKEAQQAFNYVISNPAYSGLIKRRYDRPNEQDTSITVQTKKLDDIIPIDVPITLIKIDIEGGEMGAMLGGINIIKHWKPFIIFEHGLGGSDLYGTTPEKMFAFLVDSGLSVSTMQRWLNNDPAYALTEFKEQFERQLNYYFIAYPKKM